MRWLVTMGFTILALCASGAITTTSTFAEEGFLPLSFKEAKVESRKTVLTGAGGIAISCTEIDLTKSLIKFANIKHATGTLHFAKCTAAGLPINSLGDSKEQILMPVEILVCLEPTGAFSTFGIAIEVSKIHLEVPSIGFLTELNGRVIGAISAKPGEALKEFKTVFNIVKESKKQEVIACKEGKAEKTHTLTLEQNHSGKPEGATQFIEGGLLEFTEAQELMDS